MFIYKYSQLNERMPYDKMKETDCGGSKHYHLGQLKLLISEIMFLTKKSKLATKVVYAGAAEGYHIAYLADMFPELIFDLWDPGRFSVDNKKNINIFNKFFTNEVARSYRDQNVLFISDIRTLDIAKFKREKASDKIDELIDNDNEMQMKWVQIIKPKYAFLKFRLSYAPGKTKTFDGQIYLQCYSPISTETRLMTNNYDKFVDYDNIEFDEKMAHFNCFARNEKGDDRWNEIMKKNNIKDIWDNKYAFYVLSCYLDKIQGITGDDDVAKLFNDIVDFMTKKYGSKYDHLYDKEN